MTDTPRTFIKGDTVYTLSDIGEARIVVQVRVMAEALTMALSLIPTLGDPRPVYDRN